jgi:hypothetical protein
MVLKDLCSPALLYLGFSLTQIVIDIMKNMYNVALLKFPVMIIFTILLNILCKRGLGVVSWLIVFIPFISMTFITTILLYVFGLSPMTGTVDYDVTENDEFYMDDYENNDNENIDEPSKERLLLSKKELLLDEYDMLQDKLEEENDQSNYYENDIDNVYLKKRDLLNKKLAEETKIRDKYAHKLEEDTNLEKNAENQLKGYMDTSEYQEMETDMKKEISNDRNKLNTINKKILSMKLEKQNDNNQFIADKEQQLEIKQQLEIEKKIEQDYLKKTNTV